MKRSLLLVMLVAVPVVAGTHTPTGRCENGGGAPALGILPLGDGKADHTFYIDDRNFLLGAGTWIYQESNGIFTPYTPLELRDPGPPHVQDWWEWVEAAVVFDWGDASHNLQRGGSGPASPYTPDELDDNEICVDDPRVTPDTLIF